MTRSGRECTSSENPDECVLTKISIDVPALVHFSTIISYRYNMIDINYLNIQIHVVAYVSRNR